jgi:hypothetical protein
MLLNKLSQGQRRQSADGFHQTVGAGKDPVLVVDGDLGEVLPEEVSKLFPMFPCQLLKRRYIRALIPK